MKGKRTIIAREFIVILLTTVFVSLVYNAISDTGMPLIRKAPPKVSVSDEEIFGGGEQQLDRDTPAGLTARTDTAEQEPFRVISLAQMRKILDGKSGIIADARTPDEYATGHIPGSLNLYAMEPENYVELIADLPRDTLVTVYCSNPHCPFARSVAELLGTFGFTNVLLYDDGYDGWIDAGLPVVTGADDR